MPKYQRINPYPVVEAEPYRPGLEDGFFNYGDDAPSFPGYQGAPLIHDNGRYPYVGEENLLIPEGSIIVTEPDGVKIPVEPEFFKQNYVLV